MCSEDKPTKASMLLSLAIQQLASFFKSNLISKLMKWRWIRVCEETMKGVEKGAHNIKLKLQDRAVLLANSHAGEGPARGAGSSPRLIEAGQPDSGRRIVLE